MVRLIDHLNMTLAVGLAIKPQHTTKNKIDSFSHFSLRSVTLVAEKERKLLKEVVKKAITPLKTRIVPQGRSLLLISLLIYLIDL